MAEPRVRLLLFVFYLQITFSLSFSSSPQLCLLEQGIALLQFKNIFSIDSFASRACGATTSYPKTLSWKESVDCCSWDGVTCDTVTGHVIGIDLSCSWLHGTINSNSTFFFLHHLQRLNLAFNDFSNSHMSSEFGRFASLTYLNLSNSNFSGQVPSEIAHLSKLVSLDFSNNNHQIILETPVLKGLLQNLTELKELNLDFVNLSLVVPNSLVNLSSSLTSLSFYDCGLKGKLPDTIFHLPNLQKLSFSYNKAVTGYLPNFSATSPLKFLDLSFTKFSGELPDSIGNLKSLKELHLHDCYFTGSIPASFWNLSQITFLHLSSNNFSGPIPSSLSNLQQLTLLYLSSNSFTGSIPDAFGKLSKLTSLFLSDNHFSGQLPSSVFNLTQLRSLDLSRNQLVGFIPSHASGLSNLTILSLSQNLLNGTLPSWLFINLPSLEVLLLQYNQLTGHVDDFHSRSLRSIYLNNNELDGPILTSVFDHLVNLTNLDISTNKLSGIVELGMFSKLKKLKRLYLSNNILSLSTSNNNVNLTLPNLLELGLSSCNISTEFPNFLRHAEKLRRLDLSNNRIHGQIPKWVWDVVGKDSLRDLNLSLNCLAGGVEQLIPWRNLQYLDLHSNLLQGPLPVPPPHIIVYSISNNRLTGEIPSLICNMSSLVILDLSSNSFSGKIPHCLGNFGNSLVVLNLRNNSFQGTIPIAFSKCDNLRNIDLNGNQLEGPIPRSLFNCEKLKVLDLGNNQLSDTFPYWLETHPKLQVLVLRSNRFHGDIGNPKSRSPFLKLRIIDLSQNKFTGLLPRRYLQYFKAIMNADEKDGLYLEVAFKNTRFPYYQYSVRVTMKGLDFEMLKILKVFTTIDFANNRFTGEIPMEIGKLQALKGLNLSHNSLTGSIPPLLGNLTNLEWLDLSSNKLIGNIPAELTDMTSLSFLNLSQNQLVGKIPQGRQFNTFENDSYSGNLDLCGFPLSKMCSIDEPPPSIYQEDLDDDLEPANGFTWKVIMMGYGCGLVLGLAIGYHVFSTGSPQWVVRMVEGEQRKMVGKAKSQMQRKKK